MDAVHQIFPQNANGGHNDDDDNGPGDGSSKSTAGNNPKKAKTSKDNSESIDGGEKNSKSANGDDVIDGNGHIAVANSVSANHGVTKPRVCMGYFEFKGKQIGKILFFWKLVRDFTPIVDINRLNGLKSNGLKRKVPKKKRKVSMVDYESSSDTDSGINRGKIDSNSKQDGNKL